MRFAFLIGIYGLLSAGCKKQGQITNLGRILVKSLVSDQGNMTFYTYDSNNRIVKASYTDSMNNYDKYAYPDATTILKTPERSM